MESGCGGLFRAPVPLTGALRHVLDVLDVLHVPLSSRGPAAALSSADRAFQVLARTSMTTNRKVRDIAEHLARTGELPQQ